MPRFIIKWFVNTVVLFLVIKITPGITVDHLSTLIAAALVFGLINAFLKPLVILLTLPLNVISLGILTLFINGFMFYLVSKIVKDFTIVNFWAAFWGAFWFSIISWLLFPEKNGSVRVSMASARSVQASSKPRYENVIDIEKVEDKRGK
jgi:putative membrane protein